MKKILIFSVLVFLVSFYAYFHIYTKKQKDLPQKTILTENQNPVELNLISHFSKIKLKFKDNLWFVISPHSYPADQDFIERNLDIMKKTPILSSFKLETTAVKQPKKLQKDPYGFNPPKAFMEMTYQDGLRKKFLIGKTKAPHGSLYILDKETDQVFVVHSLFGQFFYYPPSMFLSKNLPLQGEEIKRIRLEKSGSMEQQALEVVWEVKNENQDHATVIYRGKNKKIPKQELFPFFEKIKNFELTNHKFKSEPSEKSEIKSGSSKKPETNHLSDKSLSLYIETEKGSNRFDFDYKRRKFYSQAHGVSARFKLPLLKELGEKIKRLMEEDLSQNKKNEK